METRCHRPTVAEQRDHLGAMKKYRVAEEPTSSGGDMLADLVLRWCYRGVDLERRILGFITMPPNLFTELKIGLSLLLASGCFDNTGEEEGSVTTSGGGRSSCFH
ncbi:hypothetical protein B296_00044877 [Ensete ventricosum]|uniref:Uncharacterized protein n=1 Tax=Ensete ventricosum TaxID=4639 RepID=A0A426Z2G6_ENSVE|nr:hypothetical protein B296_00044877 [Ensete ventricosum]